MGAFYGHMNHLYDNGSLTFGKLKHILTSAAAGELVGTEKLDGMNLYVSYSVLEGKAKAVRNAGNIKSGGLDAEELAKKFSGRKGVEEAFNTAFQGFEKAVRTLTPKKQIDIFGKNAEIFYNAEVIDDRAVNIINYNTRSLVIHRVGHVYYNKKSGKIEPRDITANFETLNRSLARMNTAFAVENFSVQINAIRRLENFLNSSLLEKTLANIEAIQGENGLTDTNHINDLLAARVVPMVRDLPLSVDGKKELIIKILNLKGSESITRIRKGLSSQDKASVDAVWNNRKNIFKQAVLPIEEIIHDFAIEALKAFESQYVLDKSEPENIRRNIRSAVNTIQNSEDDKQISVLMKQLEKLKDIESAHISTTEGFVFAGPDGVTYKLTANFAPINQILGLARSSASKTHPDIVHQLKEQDAAAPSFIDIKRTVGIYPGKFKPPHNGHVFSIKEALKKCTNVLILVAPVERSLKDGTNITWQNSIDLLKLFLNTEGIGEDRVTVIKSSNNSPVRAMFEVLNGENEAAAGVGYPSEGDLIIPIRSDKLDPKSGRIDKETGFKDPKTQKPDWHIFADFHEYESEFPNVWAADVTEFVIPAYKGLGATEFRKALEEGEDISKFIPSSVNPDVVYNILGVKKKEQEKEIMDSEYSLDEDFQKNVAKTRTSAGHKKLLDTGQKHLTKYGKPFNQPRTIDKSNAFLARESEGQEISPDTPYGVINKKTGDIVYKTTYKNRNKARSIRDRKDLEHGAIEYTARILKPEEIEESSMSGGNIAGHVGGSFSSMDVDKENKKHKKDLKKKFKREDFKMESREEIVAELKLRGTIKRMLKVERIKFVRKSLEEAIQNFDLRSVLQTLISEADVEKSPHSSTAINKLERLLDEIVSTLEDGYKALTTNDEQRESYRKHILSAIENALAPAALADKVSEEVNEVGINVKDTDGDGQINVDPLNASDEDKYIDVRNKDQEPEEKSEEEDEEENFGIEGLEKTGRDDAYRDFKQIKDKVIASYNSMHDPNDKDVFYDYLLTNVKMHFDNFEEELGNIKGEPESDSYDPDASPMNSAPEEQPLDQQI